MGAFDRKSAEKLHPNDKKRIVRALEIVALTGMTITEHDEMSKKQPPRYGARILALTYSDRAQLYRHIDRRVDGMLEKGLVGEVRRLLDMGLGKAHTAMQAIGYKEIAEALMTGGDLETAAEAVKTESRRYAKRQLSWFKRDKSIRWLEWEKEPDFAAASVFRQSIWYKLVTMKPSKKKLKETAKYDTIVSPSQKERTAHHVKNTEFAGYLSQSGADEQTAGDDFSCKRLSAQRRCNRI